GKGRLHRRVIGPVELRLGLDGLGIAQALSTGGTIRRALADHGVLFANLAGVVRLHFLRQQCRGHTHGARGVGDIDHRIILVMRVDLHRRMRLGSGGAADHQGQSETLALHFTGDMDHFIQRRSDQAGEADDVAFFLNGGLEDLVRRHHHAEVDNVVAVTAQHHADDVLANIVHIALDRGHEDLALGFRLVAFFRFDKGNQMSDGLLHHPGGLDHLGQEHLARAEQVADHVHAGHQRAFDDLDGTRALLAAFLGVFNDKGSDALDQRVLQTLFHRQRAPLLVFHFLDGAAAAVVLGDGQQRLGAIGIAIEHHVLDGVTQLLGNLVVDFQLAGVDDTHGQAVADCMQQEYRVNRLAYRVVATEGEGHVGYAAGGQRIRQLIADIGAGLDEVHRVVVVFLDAGGDGEDVRVEDDVFRREAHLVDQNVVAALADFLLARGSIGLANLVEGHYHHGGAVALA